MKNIFIFDIILLTLNIIKSEDNIIVQNQVLQPIYQTAIPNNIIQSQNLLATNNLKQMNYQNSFYQGINIQPSNLQYEPSLNYNKQYENNFISYSVPQSYTNIELTDDVYELLKSMNFLK